MKINKELLKGSTTMLVLELLESENMYGYQMIKKLREKSENIFELKEGTLYPILHALEEKAWITSYWDEGTAKDTETTCQPQSDRGLLSGIS